LSASITLLERKSYEKDESEASKRQVDRKVEKEI
jgi:hypothetical protein